ncbi:Parapinopsin [Larimichthys crocea]|uniref:Parapinopsin n=1 Tax=Larimichthys crocea TaxID=215358 RepID=A0A6G0J4K7_LARCR|nr:Parapinopsin [Larimichthys crocea]
MHKQLRQPLNYALVNMAVADLGTAMTGGVLAVVNNAQGYFSLGRTGCVMEGFAVSLCGITSLCTVALIAVERMFVVSKMACLEDGAVAKGEMKVAFMVVLMVLTFLISWLPYAGLSMLVVYNPDVEIHPLVGTVPVYLAKSSTVYNPIIYIYLNKQFRKYTVPFLLCWRGPFEEDETSEMTIESSNNKVSPT